MVHWHVQRHAEDDDVHVAEDLGGAMDYAARELGYAAQHAHESISLYGEAGDFELAYRAWERCERYHGARENAENIAVQYSATDENDRAPLYRGPGWIERLGVAAAHTMDEVNRNSPAGFHIRVCTLAADCPEFAAFGED